MISNMELMDRYDTIVVWGAGKNFDKYALGGGNVLPVSYIVDSDEKKWGTQKLGIIINPPGQLLKEDPSRTAVVICSIFWKEIIQDIMNYGIRCDVFTSDMITPNPFPDHVPYKKGYALFAEDAIIQGLSARYRKPIRHYVDIGVNHPVRGNATYAFYLMGSDGVCVEPNPRYADAIRRYRSHDVYVPAGISSDDEDGKAVVFYNIPELDSRSTLEGTVAEKLTHAGFACEKFEVTLRSLNAVCAEYGKPIDYISVDVETHEYAVLKDFDFERYDVAFFNIEKGDVRVKELLLRHHYELVSETVSNWIFAKEGLAREKLPSPKSRV